MRPPFTRLTEKTKEGYGQVSGLKSHVQGHITDPDTASTKDMFTERITYVHSNLRINYSSYHTRVDSIFGDGKDTM